TATPELLATIRLGRGAAWQLLNRGEDAEAEYRAALELAHRARAYDIELRALGNLGDLAEHRQDYAAAMARYREAVAMVDTLRGRQRGDRDAVKTIAVRAYAYEAMVHLLGRRHGADPDSGFAALAFTWAERARARAFLDLA